MELNQYRYDDVEIDLKEIFFTLLRKSWLICLVGVIFALITMIGTELFITPQYQSVTKMYILAKQNSDVLSSSDLQISTLLTKDYTELIQSRTVTEKVIAKLGLDMTHEELLSKLEISTQTDTRIVTIGVKDEDPYVARDLANAIRDTAAEHIKEVMNSEAVNIVDEANIPTQKCSPNVTRNGMMSGFLGCMVSLILIVIFYINNDTIENAEDVEHYLELSTLGVIPLNKEVSKKVRKKKINNR